MDAQNRLIVFFLPKTETPSKPRDHRPITLLNTDYKLLARILANRLRAQFSSVLRRSQLCGIPGSKIFDVVSHVRAI